MMFRGICYRTCELLRVQILNIRKTSLALTPFPLKNFHASSPLSIDLVTCVVPESLHDLATILCGTAHVSFKSST